MDVFHVFQVVQMLPNRATHHIWLNDKLEVEQKGQVSFRFSTNMSPFTENLFLTPAFP